MGAGDARYSLHLARTEPEIFAIAMEPSLDGLRATARSLVRRPIGNIALIVSAVESAPLGPIADAVTVHFPWGTLLAAVLGEAPLVLASVASLARPGARVRVLVSATERDGHAPLTLDGLTALGARYDAAELALAGIRPATRDDVAAARSSWGKRLDAGGRRPAFVIEAVRR